MELDDAWAMGRELLDTHGLNEWTLTFDRAKRRAGLCRYNARTISLSRHLTALHSAEEVRDTLLHEIAHALAGADAGHGPQWRAAALRIGASGRRTLATEAALPPAPWQGRCPGGHEHHRYRRPSRPVSCTRCCPTFCMAHLITWTHRGEAHVFTPEYRKALLGASWRAARTPACPRCGKVPTGLDSEEIA